MKKLIRRVRFPKKDWARRQGEAQHNGSKLYKCVYRPLPHFILNQASIKASEELYTDFMTKMKHLAISVANQMEKEVDLETGKTYGEIWEELKENNTENYLTTDTK